MKEKRTILMDVDGVLRDIVTPIIQIYRKTHDRKFELGHDDMSEYEITKHMPKAKTDFKGYSFKHPEEIFLYSKPYPKALETLKQLHEKYNIHIATSQYKGMEWYTAKWLIKNNVEYDNISFIRDKWKLRADYIVDDNIEVLVGTMCANNGIIPICLSRPWNTKWKGRRISDLSELESMIKKIEGEKNERRRH